MVLTIPGADALRYRCWGEDSYLTLYMKINSQVDQTTKSDKAVLACDLWNITACERIFMKTQMFITLCKINKFQHIKGKC